jgi:CRP/FNR family transcriptional regulator, cyclic AMP receptor protein
MAKTPDPSASTGFPIRGWFAEIDPVFRREILAVARPKSYAAGSVIYQSGDVGRDVFGVGSGVVTMLGKLSHPDAVLLHMLRPGDWFGTVPVLIGRSRRITAVARTDVDILRVPGDELRALIRRHPEWAAELGRDLAMLCNVSRNTFSRVLKEFTSRRLVTLGYRSLTVNDPARLRDVADGG